MTTAFMQVSIECEGSDIFVVADGVKIAKLGHPCCLRWTREDRVFHLPRIARGFIGCARSRLANSP